MKSNKAPNQNQMNMFNPILKEMLDPKNELYQLADKIDWQAIEDEFSDLYSHTGRPGHPIRLMVSLLILKQLYQHGDESLPEVWVQNPYYQYFSGFDVFQWKFPIAPSDLVHFRKRIGKSGAEFILKSSLDIQDQRKVKCEHVVVDTTVQPKNITFPTDSKLRKKVIEKCVRLAEKEGITLRRSYRQEVKRLMKQVYNGGHPRRKKAAKKANKRLKTIANALLRELYRKLDKQQLAYHAKELEKWSRAANQERNDKNKIYSLHEEEVACIAKGKAHPKYEFGSKVSFITTLRTNLILGITNFQGNPHDSKTLEESFNSMERITGKRPSQAIGDRGYRGPKSVEGVEIIRPTNGKGKSGTERRKAREKMRRRAAIEPIISHAKNKFGMIRNYLKGTEGDELNALLAASAFNFRSWMREKAEFFVRYLFSAFYKFKIPELPTFIQPLGFGF